MFLIAPLMPTVDQSALVDKACRLSGLTHDRVARIYGVSPEQFYQQIRGVGHFSMKRLFLMAREEDGRKFLRAYWPLAAEAMGMPDLAGALEWRDQFVALINGAQKTMGRAELQKNEDKECA